MGSSKISRAKGAQIAIKKIVTDSSLLTGARFGYGWWNAGTEKKRGGKAKNKWCAQCEYTCNKECPFGKGNQRKNRFGNVIIIVTTTEDGVELDIRLDNRRNVIQVLV